MTEERLALDAESVRHYDQNGNLHVKVSHLTKAQVRPYYGSEIPEWRRLGLEPTKIYRGYAPPEELSKQETVESTNGIPIQLNHHPDYADAPRLETRVGSTGTDGAFRAPYLDNSLHITVEDAIKRILDGSMRELSLAYRYTPDFTAGTTPDGEPYDFVMRGISANHLALVEQGRAGRDVLVQDSHLKEAQPMDVTEKQAAPAAQDGEPAVEKKEVALADAIASAAQGIKDLHTQDQEGNVVDKPTDAATAPEKAPAEDEDKDAAIKRIIAEMVSKGLKPADAEGFMGALQDLAYTPDEAHDSDEADGAEDEDDMADELIQDALKACGYDEEPEEFQKAFAEGVRYGERKEKEEPKKLDAEHEREGEERHLHGAQDAALKAVEKRIMSRFAAMDECEKTLGKVRANAYDSAEDVYLAALKQEGMNIRGIKPQAARAAYRAFMAGKSRSSQKLAQDSAPQKASSLLINKLSQIKQGY